MQEIKIAKPEVKVLGETVGYPWILEELGMETGFGGNDAEEMMEFAGRGCYQAFHKPNPATKQTPDYLKNIIAQGHESVLEHATVSFYITGVSRALTHELVRHRHLNYSQQSQRFVNEEEARLVLPPAVKPESPAARALQKATQLSLETYKGMVRFLQEEEGLPRKQAREAARAVLPNCIETRITVTGNHRALRQYLWRRLDPAADAEIREVSKLMFKELYVIYPALYEDIKEHYEL